MKLIRDLRGMEKVDPEWIKAFEYYMPQWLMSLKPHYLVAKENETEALFLHNVISCSHDLFEIEKDGISYCLGKYPMFGKVLEFNGKDSYYPVNWKEGFDKIYTEPVDSYGLPSFNWLYYHNYTVRYLNRQAPYNELAIRIEKLFQEIVDDPNVAFDFGSTSYILLNPKKKDLITRYYLLTA